MQSQPAIKREFGFTASDFESVRKRLSTHAGIVLSDIKQDMVYNRLVRRLRILGIDNIKDYLAVLDNPATAKEEFIHFINSLTTNLTAFFREPHHFEFLEKELLSQLNLEDDRPLKIWSAGCSIGEEPYTLAMVIDRTLKGQRQTKILATDIDTQVLDIAQQGIYDQERVQKLDQDTLKQFFLKGKNKQDSMVKIKPELRSMVTFKPLNLVNEWPMKGPFDIIFCRNVMIYFNKSTQRKLIAQIADLLAPNGLLFVGHAENLHLISDRFQPLGQTIYRRID